MLDRTHEYERMAEAEGSLWWYRALHLLVLRNLQRHSPRPLAEARVLDAGCGTGGLMTFLRAHGVPDVRGFDVSADAVAWCRHRGLDVQQADLRQLSSLCPAASLDAVVSNDTLCYLDPAEQEDFVRQCASRLRPGGLLLCNLPALAAFRGMHDVSVGIRQRFSRRDLRRLLPGDGVAPLRLLGACYWPFVASPLIWTARAAQRWRMRREPSAEIRSDVELPPRWINAILLAATRAENRLLSWKPFASSLFVVAVR